MNLKFSTRRQFLSEKKSTGNRLTIGFAGIADLRSFIGLEYINYMMKACEDYDINFINMGQAVKYSLFDDINFIQNYTKYFKFMKKPFIDGLVTWTSSFWDYMSEDKIIKTFSELSPLPMVDIGYMNIPNSTHLKINSVSAIEQIINHLVKDHGYTKLAFFGADTSSPHWNRLATFKKELQKHGLKEIDNSIYMAKTMGKNHISEKVNELIRNHNIHDKKEIEAIVTSTDIIAAEVIEQLAEQKVSVPQDIAITGFNNWYEGISARSPLTTIDLAYYQRGYRAIEILIDKIANEESAKNTEQDETIYFEPTLIIRQSCGCFEHSINKVGKTNFETINFFSKDISERELRLYLKEKSKNILQNYSDEEIDKIINYFFEDMYNQKDESKLLYWFQNILQNQYKNKHLDSEAIHNSITLFRNILIPILKNDGIEAVLKIENIFHQMRTFVSIFQKYESIASRENPYELNNITQHAISFTNSTSFEEILKVLVNQLTIFDVSFVVLTLSEKMSFNFPAPKIKLIYPEQHEESNNLINETIFEPHLFPKKAFPNNRRYSITLEILHHADYNFGYAFFEMKKSNIAHYDVLRMLLSNAFYSMYKKNEEDNYEDIISDKEISKLIYSQQKTISSKKNILLSESITNYLIKEIGQTTNVEKMAKYFSVSKSYLSKKTKEITGLSIQTLHEKIKIEQAKKMLLTGNFKLSEISEKLGFSNQNYFSNVFKKNTGLSPNKWLKNN